MAKVLTTRRVGQTVRYAKNGRFAGYRDSGQEENSTKSSTPDRRSFIIVSSPSWAGVQVGPKLKLGMSPAASCQHLRPEVAFNAIIRQANLLLGASIFVLSIACDASSASAQLTFNFTNQGTATPQMMAGFAQAGVLWSAYLKDPITINIRVGASAL